MRSVVKDVRVVLILTAALVMSAKSLAANYGGGTGVITDPYQIWTPEQMNTIGANSADWNKHFKLMADIDMSAYTGTKYNIIGNLKPTFTGVFEGNGHVIRNLICITSSDYCGLFGLISSRAEIRNLGVENINISGGSYAGGLVGKMLSGSISNCYCTGSVTSRYYSGGLVGRLDSGTLTNSYNMCSVSSPCPGGLVGLLWDSTITNCYNTGSITATNASSSAGGLVGQMNAGAYYSIRNCYNTGPVTSPYSHAGGLVGTLSTGNIDQSYNTGLVKAQSFAGGLVGHLQYGTISQSYSNSSVDSASSWAGGLVGKQVAGEIISCYSRGHVIPPALSGGLVGEQAGGVISTCYSTAAVGTNNYRPGILGGLVGSGRLVINSFWDIETSGLEVSSGGKGRTSAQMKEAANYIAWNTKAQTCWTIDEGNDYPRLAWEKQPGIPLSADVIGDFIPGSGTASNPYLISTPAQFNTIGLFLDAWDKFFRLGNDIDLSGIDYNPIGLSEGPYAFWGTFDGAGHVIRNLSYLENMDLEGVGLFGYIANATIKNLGVDNINLSAKGDCVGGLAGYFYSSSITNCRVTGSVVSNPSSHSSDVGGLVGQQWEGIISGCYSLCSVSAFSSSDNKLYVGGLVGRQFSSSSITKIVNCYSAGLVCATGISSCRGGLLGWRNASAETVSSSFWDTQTSGLLYSAGGKGKTTAEMKTLSTFISAGWDFTGTWFMPYNSYPHLLWDKYSGGSGTEADPYRIGHAEDIYDMMGLSGDWNKYFILTADIDMGGANFTRALIASDTNPSSSGFQGTAFSGVFDGNSFIIYHFTIDCAAADYIGLFGKINVGGIIQKLGIENCTITGTTGSFYVGTLAGYQSGNISMCYATGGIGGACNYVGGLVGWNYSGSIDQCYSACVVNATAHDGGLVGYISGAGSLVARSFWDVQVSQQESSAGGIGKTTAEMKTISTFTDAGWDFVGEAANGTVDIWRMCGDGVGYPQLSWEFGRRGDFACPDGVGVEDLEALGMVWLTAEGQAGYSGACDANGDGRIDMADFEVLAGEWMGD